jgi:hypothetical protein
MIISPSELFAKKRWMLSAAAMQYNLSRNCEYPAKCMEAPYFKHKAINRRKDRRRDCDIINALHNFESDEAFIAAIATRAMQIFRSKHVSGVRYRAIA